MDDLFTLDLLDRADDCSGNLKRVEYEIERRDNLDTSHIGREKKNRRFAFSTRIHLMEVNE